MTARQAPKYPFRPKKTEATTWGGFMLVVMPLTALLVALWIGVFWSAWRASICSL